MKIQINSEIQKQYKHLNRISYAVDCDKFIEFILDTTYFLREEKEQQIKDVFLSVDVQFK